LNPEVGKNGAVHVAGDQLTWREAVHAFEKVQEVEYDVIQVPKDEAKEQEEEFYRTGKIYEALTYSIRRVFQNGNGWFPQTENHHFDVVPEKFDTFAKRFIKQQA
jgi:hypothetical protein